MVEMDEVVWKLVRVDCLVGSEVKEFEALDVILEVEDEICESNGNGEGVERESGE